MRVRQKEIVPDTFAFVSTSMDVNVECLTGTYPSPDRVSA
jgi:hypothetical protein